MADSDKTAIAIVKVHSTGRITIPKDIRDDLTLRDGDSVIWLKDNAGRYFIAKARKPGVRYVMP